MVKEIKTEEELLVKSLEAMDHVWSMRAMGDSFTLFGLLIFIFAAYLEKMSLNIILISWAIALFVVTELVCIWGFFNKKRWAVPFLHVSSAVSLLHIPYGIVLSVMHFRHCFRVVRSWP